MKKSARQRPSKRASKRPSKKRPAENTGSAGATSPAVPLEALPPGEWPADALWRAFKSGARTDLAEVVLHKYLPMIKLCADRLSQRLPASFDSNDLHTAGYFGLVRAIEGFDPERGVKFETYASQRITGSMLDDLRQLDWVPRQVRSKSHQASRAVHELEVRLGRAPRAEEMASALGVTLDELDRFLQSASATAVTSLHRETGPDGDDKAMHKIDVIEDHSHMRPPEQLGGREVLGMLTGELSRKERLILVLYYYEALTMKQIGSVLGLSESRVCQVHGRVVGRLRDRYDHQESVLFAAG